MIFKFSYRDTTYVQLTNLYYTIEFTAFCAQNSQFERRLKAKFFCLKAAIKPQHLIGL